MYTIHMPGAPRIRIDLDSTVPVYRQIVDAMRIYLVEGSLRPGDAVPSVRQLALALGVHFNTVGEAYRQLADEGWLDLRHGRRAVVLERARPATLSSEKAQEFRIRLRNLVAEARAQGMSPAGLAAELRALAEGLTK